MENPSTQVPLAMTPQVHNTGGSEPLVSEAISNSRGPTNNSKRRLMHGPSTRPATSTVQQADTPTEKQADNSHVPPAPPPAKRHKMTSKNHPSLKTMLPILEQHVESCGGITNKTSISILWEACCMDDYFYVALHQMFCLWTLNPLLVASVLMRQEMTGLDVSFSFIRKVMETSAISTVNTKFFSKFPCNIICASDHYKLTLKRVEKFLAKLLLEWPKYSLECAQRRYPPLVAELLNRFGLYSGAFQRVIFVAIRLDMGFPNTGYGAQMDQIFNHDLAAAHQMAARINTAYPQTEKEIEEHNQWCVNNYSVIHTRQMQQMERTRLELDPVRPSQPLPENVQSPSNVPSTTQAGHPPYIQTDAMPSDVLTVSPRSGALLAPPRCSQPPLTRQTPNGSVSQHSSRAPMPNGQSLQQPTGRLHPSNRQNQVNHIVRSASRNASRNGSVPQFPGASSAGSLPVLSNPVRRSSPLYTNAAPALASMPASQGSPLLQQQVRVPLIPLVGYTPPYQLPQPDRLLQAHLSGSILHIDAGRGLVTNQTVHRCYQAVRGFAVKPTTLPDSPRVTKLTFTVSKSTFRNVAEDKHIAEDKLSDPAAPLLREVRQGSLQYRVHCGRTNKGTRMKPTGFIATDTEWPPTILIDMNDSALIIQRKGSYGHSRDQPVDITPHVFSYGPAKKNSLAITVLNAPGARNGIPYSIAIEVVEVFQHQQIVDMCLKTQRITAKDVIEDIRLKLSERNVDEDDDVALVSAKLTIALRDPLTASIFTTPVRGVQCRHRECFDLDTFLMSRSNNQEFTCMPDAWKCPLCGGDTRPRLLRVDEFLVSVREKLKEDGDLEVKAILVAEDGSWTAKPEALPAERSKSWGSSGSVSRRGCDYSSPAVSSRQAPGHLDAVKSDFNVMAVSAACVLRMALR
ncbi:hypothetical protein VE00_01399 [Pseudogymnoascus sp. WSF 3629]|nr:hypothetical protein VE00_01399 [Pseudogymnoascus sp. WSF 3629]